MLSLDDSFGSVRIVQYLKEWKMAENFSTKPYHVSHYNKIHGIKVRTELKKIIKCSTVSV